MIKTKLNKNDIVSLQSLSAGLAGEDAFKHRYLIGKERLKTELGLRPIESEHSLKGIKFISEHPELRAKDLMTAMKDPEVKGIIANIGGVDSHLLWPYIDLDVIKENPKPLIGFSDTTSLHLMFYKAGVQSYYGPSVLDGFAENVEMHKLTKDSFYNNLFNEEYEEVIKDNSDEWTSEMLEWTIESNNNIKRTMNKETHGLIWSGNNGIVKGHLLGGCLDSLITLTEEEFFPSIEDWRGSIMFLETSESKMSKEEFKDALIKLKDQINVCSGIIFGKPKDEANFDEYLSVLEEIVDKPYVFNLNFGHTAPIMTIPYGSICKLDLFKKNILIKMQT